MISALALALAVSSAAPSPLDDANHSAGAAAYAFLQACVLRLPAARSAADYARGSAELGAEMQADPSFRGQPWHVEGAAGRTCRVVYAGGSGDILWSSVFKFLTGQAGCRERRSSAVSLDVACPAQADTPAFDATLERSGRPDNETVVAAITDQGR